MKHIENTELRPEHLPKPDASWDEIQAFALTFSGYEARGSFERCAKIANARRDSTLFELRACLFFEQRRWRHFGDNPDEETMEYL